MLSITSASTARATNYICEVANSINVGRYFLSATMKELLKSDSISETYAQMKKGPVFSDSQCTLPIYLY